MEQCNVAIQTVLPNKRIPAGVSLIVFIRSIGSSLGVAIGQNLFDQRLRKNLTKLLPGIDVNSIIGGSGSTNLLNTLQQVTDGDEVLVRRALGLYNDAVTQVFLAALILFALTVVPTLGIEWKSVKKEKRGKKGEEQGKEKHEVEV